MAEASGDAAGKVLVALDVDGTLVDYHGVMSANVRACVRDVVAAGHDVVIASGRSVPAVLPVLEALDLDRGWAVCSNGAVTLRLDPGERAGYQVQQVRTFDPADALARLRPLLPDAALASEDLGNGYLVTAPFPERELVGAQTPARWEEIAAQPAVRLVVRSWDHTVQEFADVVRGAQLEGVAAYVGWTAWLDVCAGGTSKASALDAVARETGGDPAWAVAIGDGINDLEMLSWAGRSVAMGNAPPEVRVAAGSVTGTVEEDGVVSALSALLRGELSALSGVRSTVGEEREVPTSGALAYTSHVAG